MLVLARSLALITLPGIHRGIHETGGSSRECQACFAQLFTHDLYAVEVRDPAVVRARYAPLVRILACVLGKFAPGVRTEVRNHHGANLGGLPVEKC